jgi:methylmalonyl-CoA mutase
MTKSLFDDFNPVSVKAWKQKIQLDLKGADYNDSLIWKSAEGIDVNNDINANNKALYAISKGAESLIFVIPNQEFSITNMLKDIDTNSILIYLDLQFLDANILNNCSSEKGIYFSTDIIGNLVKTGN